MTEGKADFFRLDPDPAIGGRPVGGLGICTTLPLALGGCADVCGLDSHRAPPATATPAAADVEEAARHLTYPSRAKVLKSAQFPDEGKGGGSGSGRVLFLSQQGPIGSGGWAPSDGGRASAGSE